METILIKALQLLLSLSILVVIHEFGHFLFARLFNIRVEKFYVFFDPWFSLFKFKPKNSDTEYGIGWLPLGGYVKISGMIDESMDKEQMAQEPKPWEFRSKPTWQRLLVMVAGVLFNFLLALFIYSMMLFTWGDSYIPTKDLAYGMTYSETAEKAGLQDGDIIKLVDGKELNLRGGILLVNDMMQFMDAKEVVVDRNGSEVTIAMPNDFAEQVIANKDKEAIFSPIQPAVAGGVVKGSLADRHGMMKGDSIVKVNDVAVTSFREMRNELVKYADSAAVTIQYYRDTSLFTITNLQISKDSLLGVSTASIGKTDTFTFLESFPAGASLGIRTLKGYVSQMRFLFSKEGLGNLGGFGAIGSMFPPIWDWYAFWSMTAFLSIILAVMNILPIPALDGGHITFLLYEVVTRRKPSEKFMEHAQVIGMLFILGLLIIANGNDIVRAFFK